MKKREVQENPRLPPVPAGPIVSLVYRTTAEKSSELIEFLNPVQLTQAIQSNQ